MSSDPVKQEVLKAERAWLGDGTDAWTWEPKNRVPADAAGTNLLEQLFRAIQRQLPEGFGALDRYDQESNCRDKATLPERVEAFVYGRTTCHSDAQFWQDLQASMSLDAIQEVAGDHASWAWQHRAEVSIAFAGLVKFAVELERAAPKNRNAAAIASLLKVFGLVVPPAAALKTINAWLDAVRDTAGDPAKLKVAQRKYADAVLSAGLVGAGLLARVRAVVGATEVSEPARRVVEINPVSDPAMAAEHPPLIGLNPTLPNSVSLVEAQTPSVVPIPGGKSAVTGLFLQQSPEAFPPFWGGSFKLDFWSKKDEFEKLFRDYEANLDKKRLLGKIKKSLQQLNISVQWENLQEFSVDELREALLGCDGAFLKGATSGLLDEQRIIQNLASTYFARKFSAGVTELMLHISATRQSFHPPVRSTLQASATLKPSAQSGQSAPELLGYVSQFYELNSYSYPRRQQLESVVEKIKSLAKQELTRYFNEYLEDQSTKALLEKIQVLLRDLRVPIGVGECLATVEDVHKLQRLVRADGFIDSIVSANTTERDQGGYLLQACVLEKISLEVYESWVAQTKLVAALPLVTNLQLKYDDGTSHLYEAQLDSRRVAVRLQQRGLENDPAPEKLGDCAARYFDGSLDVWRVIEIVAPSTG